LTEADGFRVVNYWFWRSFCSGTRRLDWTRFRIWTASLGRCWLFFWL